MGVSRLSGLCLALFLIPSLASANYIYDHSTGRWLPTSSTVLAPPNASSVFTSNSNIPPNPTVNNGALTIRSGGSFGSPTVNGATQRVPVTINGTVTKPNVNKAVATRLLRGGLHGVVLGYGIEQLLSGIDALIDPNGTLSTASRTIYNDPPSGATVGPMQIWNQWNCTPTWTAPPPQDKGNGTTFVGCANGGAYPQGWGGQAVCVGLQSGHNGRYLIGWNIPAQQCYYSEAPSPIDYIPVSQDDLEAAIDSNYQPHPSDYPLIVSEPEMRPTVINVEPIPRLNFPSVTTTYTDLDTGQVTTKETNIWHDFDIRNNNSDQPKIETQETEQTKTYTDGVQTSESTTTLSSGVATGGASSPAPVPTVELPSFCSWASIVCDWIGWTQEPIEEDDLDLAALINDEDFEKSYTISFGSAVCPAPIEINIAFIGQTVELSYEPACEFVGYAKPFILISAYLFAIYITLGVIRNG